MLKRFLLKGYVFTGLLVCMSVSYAANVSRTPAEMLKEAMEHMQAERFEDAVALMYMYIGEVEESKAPRVIAIVQDTRFKMATVLIKADRLDEAAAVLQEYIEHPIGTHPRLARKMLATCYFEIEEYESCVGAATNAVEYNANPIVEARKVTKGNDEEMKFDEAEPEADFTPDELVLLHLTLAESWFNLEKWAECIEPFEYVIEHTPDEQRKGYAIMQVVNALIKIPDFGKITEWIPQLYRTTARFDIRVNLALMNAAAALYDEGEYDNALPLYRMILPRNKLIAYQEGQLREMRIAAGLPPDMDEELSAAEISLFGAVDDREATDTEKNTDSGLLIEKPKELLELENLIIALKALPPYEFDIQYRMADLYKMVERHWEALRFFDQVYTANPESEIGERSIYELIDTLIEDLLEPEEAARHGFDYMQKHPKGITPRQIAYILTGYYQKNGIMESVKDIKPYLDGLARTNDATIVKYDTELYFMQAIADLMLLNYEEAEAGFKYVLEEFPQSHQEANSLYWHAMAKLFLQKYNDAHSDFETYIKRFSTETYIDECHFQAGICLFGMEKYDEAIKRFALVIDTYPDSSVYPEACSMRGDILGSRGMLDEAIADYERAISAAKKPTQATYAVFQMASVYEAEDKYEEIIRCVEAYLDHWKADADISKALFWIGKTKIQQQKFNEAVETYVDAIVKYGTDVKEDGVDLMIAELIKVSAIYLDTEQQAKLKTNLQTSLETSDDLTLQLRLRVTLAQLDYTEFELGKQLITELSNLENASPPVLACICNASFELQDYARAEELLQIFTLQFEDSEYMRAAYKLRGYGQYAEKDYEGTLQTVEEAQETYGTDRDVAWAQLMKAQVQLDQGKIDEARETNMNLLTVPSWRGEPVAQATFQLGQVEEQAHDPLKAFGFYQRTYFQYKGHAGGHWAAEAYLASARCLKKMGLENDRRNTYRAMLFDPYVNTLPQADEARTALGASEVAEILTYIETGGTSNITITVEVPAEVPAEEPAATEEDAS